MVLASFFEIEWWTVNAPIVVGLVTSFGVMFALLLWEERHRDTFSPLPGSTSTSAWSSEFEERRSNFRRTGNPILVDLLASALGDHPEPAFVIDRSSCGVRLAFQGSLVPGMRCHIRPESAPESTPWVPLVVRHQRMLGKYTEVGCQFEQIPPTHILLQFG